MITQEYLKNILKYNPVNGEFHWLIDSGPGVYAGDSAGYISHNGYLRIKINGIKYAAHRLIFLYMIGRFPEEHTDHINHNRSDNRWINLREVTNLENRKNARKSKNNTSGFTGVHWDKGRKKWKVRIKVNKKLIDLGRYTDINDAAEAREKANKKYGFHENHGK